ncbi:hypothetical protein H696_03743 [Fonticula alba]|uniref:Uncharacterized protein n=1 Tax=Fonticula alba TaxID=691883 RepID=A0A058Z5A6_FONAL|nr:hypothetical protein H696_03743 [Fonticula alba]KCV69311.1 hypothetical protein H696_03743 [Fonticula alba]|eukprot:XP_009495876.1 hypothetical protein H696_03743 [Fonticula alba]
MLQRLIFCKPSTAMCCTILAICGIIFGICMGLAYKFEFSQLVSGPAGHVANDPAAVATSCFIAAGLYVACLLVALCQMGLSKAKARNSA